MPALGFGWLSGGPSRVGPGSAGGGLLGEGPGVGEPVGLGAGLDDRAVEGEPIDDGRAKTWVGERLRSAAEGLVGGDGDAGRSQPPQTHLPDRAVGQDANAAPPPVAPVLQARDFSPGSVDVQDLVFGCFRRSGP